MSEQQTETPSEPETPEEEPVSPQEPEPENPDAEPEEPIEGADEDADEAQEGSEDEATARAVNDERELAKRDQKLDAENTRHAKRVGEIMDEAAVDLIPCPVCMDGIAGWIYPPDVQQLGPDAVARVRQVIGLPDYSTFKQADFARVCPACDGLGEVVTGSHVPGYETTECETCAKQGWVRVQQTPANGEVQTEPEQVVTGPTVFRAGDDDLYVRHLRERGWTAIPPMQVQAG